MRNPLRAARWKAGVLAMAIAGAAVLTACGADLQAPVVAVAGGDADHGADLLRTYGCISCHTVPGIAGADQKVAPPLNDWSERVYIAGSLANEPDNLMHWIQNPQEVEPGTAMPNLNVTDEDARDIAAYLYSLR